MFNSLLPHSLFVPLYSHFILLIPRNLPVDPFCLVIVIVVPGHAFHSGHCLLTGTRSSSSIIYLWEFSKNSLSRTILQQPESNHQNRKTKFLFMAWQASCGLVKCSGIFAATLESHSRTSRTLVELAVGAP